MGESGARCSKESWSNDHDEWERWRDPDTHFHDAWKLSWLSCRQSKCRNISIFSDFLGNSMTFFMDDFSVFGNDFDSCLAHLTKILQVCIKKQLVLSWEKSHFMVREGVVLVHIVSGKGLEVDKAKIEVIQNLLLLGTWQNECVWLLNTHDVVSKQSPNLPIQRLIHELKGMMVNKGWIHRELGKFERYLWNLIKLDDVLRLEIR